MSGGDAAPAAIVIAISIALRLQLGLEVPKFLHAAVPAVWAAWGRHHASRDRKIAAASLGAASFLVMTVLVAVTYPFALTATDVLEVAGVQLLGGVVVGLAAMFCMWIANRPATGD